MSLKISESLNLPRGAATWVISYVAKRGAGKTYCAADQAEEMMKAGIPIVVVDGMGIWWGLRVNADRVHAGLPVVVFGGDHADLPLVTEKASEMAKAIVESNISCVLDLSGFSKYAARKIVKAFLDELYRLNRAERHVIIEEADLWAPQRTIGPDEALCLSSVDNFVRRGGNHNLGCTLITQRSAVLNKDILTQSDCLVVLRTLAPQDKKAIQAWVEEQTDEDKKELNKWYDTLKELQNGEAWIWHPEKPKIFEKIQFRQRETFHATREFIRSPEASRIVLMDVNEFVSRFRNVFEVKQAEKPKPEVKQPTLPRSEPKLVEPQKPLMEEKLKEPEPQGNQVVTQALPNIQISQYKPTITVPVEMLDEPTSAIGKLAVILKNDAQAGGRRDKWSVNRLKSHIRDHGWDDNSIDEAVVQFVRWEILVKLPGGYMRFDPERVQIVAVTM